ncbi:MAG: type II toxin-antitoxin system VapC family toxin [Alphaproteobacteria bacterium]
MMVLDASVAAAWVFQDEQTPKALEILDLIAKDGAIVPPLWHDELTHVLMVGYRRGRLSSDQVAIFLNAVADLPLKTADVVTVTKRGLWQQKESWGLSGYDAAYLHLALQRSIPLATLDQKLAATAERVGVAGV